MWFIRGSTSWHGLKPVTAFLASETIAVGYHNSKRHSSAIQFTTAISRQSQPCVHTTKVFSARLPSNSDLVQRRLQVAREKQEARRRSLEQRWQRNLHLQRLVQNHTREDTLFALKVTVSEDLRAELQLSGREKRGRVFVERDAAAAQSYRALTKELHAFFRALRKDTFVLRASYPQLKPDGSVVVDSVAESWTVETDKDVVETFEKADAFFQQHDALKRPSLILHVDRHPNAPPPPPPPAYLQNMADPDKSPTMTMLSFYAFPPNGIQDPEEFATKLQKLWKPFRALGRIYVAREGVNAQMSVPTNVLEPFMECCRSVAELQYLENGFNIDPIPLTHEEFARAGVPATGEDPANAQPRPPFTNLHIRVRRQVVADGLDKEYDWREAGYDMPPLEWHEKLKRARELQAMAKQNETTEQPLPVILDCRNTYETTVGRFEGAEPLDTENFRDSWKVLEERLADTPKDAPIMTYCTGGIRCVKVGAYLTQELGFTNVSRLAGGIISYDRTLQEKAPGEESMFKGTNFVFDGRLGRPITEDALGTCITCGTETSLVSNCRNANCHKRIIQCEECRTSYQGTCSDPCRQRLVNGMMRPRRPTTADTDTATDGNSPIPVSLDTFKTIDEYSTGYSSPVPSVYVEIEHNTRTLIPSGSHMVSGDAQGKLLTQLASMTREGRILELGTFTGYATACLLEGAANAVRMNDSQGCGTRQKGPYVLTMERDSKAFDVAVSHLSLIAKHGYTETAAESLCALRSSNKEAPVADSDTVTVRYDNLVTCELARVSDALASVEQIANGVTDDDDNAPGPFDMVFVDADKTRLYEYVNACLSSDRLLKKGGVIVVDNVLWKGLVLEAQSGDFISVHDREDAEDSELRRNRRARKLANKMHRFNQEIVHDARAEVMILPLRDGLSIIRKK